jgi:hypothetical protein
VLALASAVFLGSESRRSHDHILRSQIRDFPNLEGQVPVFISPGTGWPNYTPSHGFLFLSPPTTCRATVEVSEPVPTRASNLNWTTSPRYIAPARTAQKKSLPLLPVFSLPGSSVFTEIFLSNGCCTVACSHSCYLTMGLHVTILWRIDPLLSADSVNSDRFWATAR